jgi:DDB1- and CUL4-associated factor 11
MEERSVHPSDHEYEEEDGLPGYGGFGPRRRQRRPTNFEDIYPKVPSEEGRALMKSGSHGSRDDFADIRRRRKNNMGERLMWRQLGIKARGSHRRANRLISQA